MKLWVKKILYLPLVYITFVVAIIVALIILIPYFIFEVFRAQEEDLTLKELREMFKEVIGVVTKY